MSFKVGDKCKVIAENSGDYTQWIGKIVTISYVDGNRYLLKEVPRQAGFWSNNELQLYKGDTMSNKYYRVLQDTPMWNQGAILERCESLGNNGGYTAINDLWDATDLQGEYQSANVVETDDNSKFFERVYPMGKLEKMVFGTKKQAQAAASALYKGDKK